MCETVFNIKTKTVMQTARPLVFGAVMEIVALMEKKGKLVLQGICTFSLNPFLLAHVLSTYEGSVE